MVDEKAFLADWDQVNEMLDAWEHPWTKSDEQFMQSLWESLLEEYQGLLERYGALLEEQPDTPASIIIDREGDIHGGEDENLPDRGDPEPEVPHPARENLAGLPDAS